MRARRSMLATHRQASETDCTKSSSMAHGMVSTRMKHGNCLRHRSAVLTRRRVFTDQLVLNGQKLFRSSLSSCWWEASIGSFFRRQVHVLYDLIARPYQAQHGSCSAQTQIDNPCAVSPALSAQLNCQELQLNMPLTSLWKTAKARSRPGLPVIADKERTNLTHSHDAFLSDDPYSRAIPLLLPYCPVLLEAISHRDLSWNNPADQCRSFRIQSGCAQETKHHPL